MDRPTRLVVAFALRVMKGCGPVRRLSRFAGWGCGLRLSASRVMGLRSRGSWSPRTRRKARWRSLTARSVCSSRLRLGRSRRGDSPPEVEEPETGEPDFDVESLHVSEPFYADETVELYGVASPAGRPREPDFAFEERDLPADDLECSDDDRRSLAADDERPPEVWRGPPSSPRRTPLRPRGARRSARARVGPWALGGPVHWCALVLSVLAAVVLLVALATHGRPASSERSPSYAPSPAAAGASRAAGSRAQSSVAMCRSACNHAGWAHRVLAVRRSVSRRVRGVRTTGTHPVAPAHDSSP